MPKPLCQPAARRSFPLLLLLLLVLALPPCQARAQSASALETLAALAATPPDSLAYTSKACLNRCLADCPAAPGQRGVPGADRTACLRACLSGCSVHCGTVDTACALDWLGKNSGAAPKDRSLAAACAQACTVKPNCPPPGPVALLTPLPSDLMGQNLADSALVGSAQAHSALVQNPAPLKGEKLFQAKENSFSLVIPAHWKQSESDTRDQGGDHELKLLAPGPSPLEYVSFAVRRITAAHKTAVRCVFDLEHPRFAVAKPPPAVSAVTLAGLPATQVETFTVRTLLGFPNEVPVLLRTVVVPQQVGYFVLVAEVPVALEPQFGPALSRLMQSFRPGKQPQERGPEVSAEEYAVYAAFLTSGGVTGGREEVPYLRETSRARSLYSITGIGAELPPQSLALLAQQCPEPAINADMASALGQDYARKRSQQVLVTDRLLLQDLRIKALGQKEEYGGILTLRQTGQPELMGRLSRPSFDDPLSVSRVGFSPDGNTALFYVSKLSTSPGTTYFVLMTRREGHWALCGALLREMRIY